MTDTSPIYDAMVAQAKEQNTISELKNEIQKIKGEFHKVQAQKLAKIEDTLFSPNLLEHYQKVAKIIANTNIAPPAYRNNPDDVLVAMDTAYRLGLPIGQAVQDIAIINGRPCLWGDGLLALVQGHPAFEYMDEEPIYENNDVIGYSCTIKRKGQGEYTRVYTLKDAKQAGLTNKKGPWQTSPSRMLQLRARSFALRDKFSDALRGVRLAEVEEDNASIIDAEVINTPPEGNTQTEKVKNLLTPQPEPIEEKEAAPTEAKEEEPSSNSPLISDEDLLELHVLMEQKELTEEQRAKILDHFKIQKFAELTIDNAEKLFRKLAKQ